MPAIDIPDPLPPAITTPRTVIDFLIDQDPDEYDDACLVARTRHWVLRGFGPEPISRMDWSQFDGNGPPSAVTLATDRTAMNCRCTRTSRGLSSMRSGSEARFICWLCTPVPGDEVPLRFRPWDAGPARARGTTTVDEPGPRRH